MNIYDTTNGKTHIYGSNCHDSLVVSEDGRTLSYYNLQNGDGSAYGDYRIVTEMGLIPSEDTSLEDLYYANIGGFTEDIRGVRRVRDFITNERIGIVLFRDENEKLSDYQQGMLDMAEKIYKICNGIIEEESK